MPKRKENNKDNGTFKTSPFRALKGLRATAPARQPERPRASAPETPEDAALLFQRAMDGARPVHDPDEGRPVRQKSDRPASPPAERAGSELFLEAMQSLGTGMLRTPADDEGEGIDPPAQRSSSSRMRQLKKGSLRISAELDLHGFLRDEALRRLERFIAAAFAQGQDAVLVITGKGINSSEGPVLRSAAEAWLRSTGTGMVAEVHPAPRDRGGSGAFVVFLKRKGRG